MGKLARVVIEDSGLPAPTPEIAQELKVAIFDLLEDNSFSLPPRDGRGIPAGPYRLKLVVRDRRLEFDIRTESDGTAAEFHLSLGPFRQAVKDYRQICESYFEAVKRLPPSRIEAIDMARRGIHDEGARILTKRLEGKADMDSGTARRLFTLICVLHRGNEPMQRDLPSSILFCCDQNAVRSPMAEGIMKKLYGHASYVQSAGVRSDLEIDDPLFRTLPVGAFGKKRRRLQNEFNAISFFEIRSDWQLTHAIVRATKGTPW